MSSTFLGHPKGVFLVAGVEFWERFSYYGMVGLLVLFLTAPTLGHGFGWSRGEALQLYGIYTGLVFAAPTVGGWISSNFLGERRSILLGGLIVTCGHLLLGGPGYVPYLIERFTEVPVHAILRDSGVLQGLLWPGPNIQAALHAHGVQHGLGERALSMAWLSYVATAWSFHLGLAFIIVGTGFIKATVSSIVSKLYPKNSPLLDVGFTIFFVSIYVGTICSSLTVGALAERLGWHYGFTAAAVGMALGVSIYLARQQALLGDAGKLPDNLHRRSDTKRPPLTGVERDRLWALVILGLFTVIYWAAFAQKGGLFNIYARDSVERNVGGFQIPTTWFLTISTFGFILLSPLVSTLWQRLETRGRNPSPAAKLALGLGCAALGYFFIFSSTLHVDATGRTSLWWLVATYVSFSFGDILVWPVQLATAARLAPERFKSMAVGAWHLTMGFGSWLTGYIGASADIYGVRNVFLGVLILCLATAASLVMLRPWVRRLMH